MRRYMSAGGLLETHANARLRAEGHTEVILEELLAGRLYTGPMYQKYNAVLRAKSGDAFLTKKAAQLCLGNSYATTVRAHGSPSPAPPCAQRATAQGWRKFESPCSHRSMRLTRA